MAGFPISLLAAAYGWTRAFLFLNFSLLVAFFALTIGKDLDQTFIPPPPKSMLADIISFIVIFLSKIVALPSVSMVIWLNGIIDIIQK